MNSNTNLRDLTQGSMLKQIISFSLPMLIGNLLQALYNTVDSIWVGNFLGPEALGAVSVSSPIIFFLNSMIIGITTAATVLIAQYTGAKDVKMVKKTINNTLLLICVSGIVISITGIFFSKDLLKLINAPAAIISMASTYLNIFLAGLVFMFGYNAASAILRGLGDSRTPLIFLSIATVLNIILDPFLILGIGPFPRMEVAGAALATTIAISISFFTSIWYLNKKGHLLSINFKEFKFDKELTLKTIKIGLPAGLQMSAVSLGALAVNSIINTFGVDIVASFGMASRLEQFSMMPSQSIGMATSAITGQNIGAHKEENVKETVKWSTILAIIISATITLIAQLNPRLLLGLFTNDQKLLALGENNLRILSLSYIPYSMMFITNGVLRGAGDTLPTLIFSLTNLWLIRVPLAKYLSSLPQLGADGIWIAIVISITIGMLLSRIYYASGRWKRKKIIEHSDW